MGDYLEGLVLPGTQPPEHPKGTDWLGWSQLVLAALALVVGARFRSSTFVWVFAALLSLLVGRALAWPVVRRLLRLCASAWTSRSRLRFARAQSAALERHIGALGILVRTGNDARALSAVLGSLPSFQQEEKLRRAFGACALFNDLWVLLSLSGPPRRGFTLEGFGNRVRLLDFAVVQFARACAEPIFDPARGAPRLQGDDRNRLLGWREQFNAFLDEYGKFREDLANLGDPRIPEKVLFAPLPFPPEQGARAAPQSGA